MIVLGWFWGCSLLRFSVCVRSRFLARRTTQASSAMPTNQGSTGRIVARFWVYIRDATLGSVS